MALFSNLFRGDRKLEACQVNDAAHLTLGTKGEHVAKVQMALYALDWLVIEPQELRSQTYGPSTAATVLKFKTKRRIINTGYQQKPDDIVGKMTISRLDQEMRLWEQVHKPRGDCSCSPAGTLASVVPETRHSLASMRITAQLVANNPVGDNSKGKLPQLGKWIRIYCSITKKASIEDGYPIALHIEKAKDRLFEYGMALSVEFKTGFADTIDFPVDEDVALLRKASEDKRPGTPKILRVIVCPQSLNAGPGQTFRNISIAGTRFKPFVVLNSKVLSLDNSTLLHEMIHAAHNAPVPHDAEPYSVFYPYAKTKQETMDRTWLKPEHAIALSKSFFAVP